MFIIIILLFIAMYIAYRLLATADPKSVLISGTKKIYAYRRLQRKKKRRKKKPPQTKEPPTEQPPPLP